MPTIHIKRIYDQPSNGDGVRIFVDRLWARGLKKEKVKIDEWAKDLAPSTELRKWYHADKDRWNDFKSKYRAELKMNDAVDTFLQVHKKDKIITLLFSAKDTTHTHAMVLQEYLQELF